MNRETKETYPEEFAKRAALADHDKDWVYTGVTYYCQACGFVFEPGLMPGDYCPDCGEAISQGSD